jgi:hypothetical protein
VTLTKDLLEGLYSIFTISSFLSVLLYTYDMSEEYARNEP